MSFSEFFRKLFGWRSEGLPTASGSLDDAKPSGSTFRDPIWKTNDDDYDDDEIYSYFREPRVGPHYEIYSDSLKITRYFETQMDNMLKNFMSQFGIMPFSFNEEKSVGLPLPFEGSSPSYQDAHENGLRDKMLKPGYLDDDADSVDNIYGSNKAKVDTDLDGNITPDEFTKIWANRQGEGREKVQPAAPECRSFGKSIVTQFVRRPDGTVERKSIFRDSQGNEETVVTRQMGEKKYVVTTRKDTNGQETKTEDFINLDEKELERFNEKWEPSAAEQPRRARRSILHQFAWDNLFEPNPKL